jgi:hypothetical protein
VAEAALQDVAEDLSMLVGVPPASTVHRHRTGISQGVVLMLNEFVGCCGNP